MDDKKIVKYEYKIPEHMVSAIINGDYSGLEFYSAEDVHILLRFLDGVYLRHGNGHWTLEDNAESEFTHSNDVLGRIGCNIVNMLYIVIK
jgi:hypothetical protein